MIRYNTVGYRCETAPVRRGSLRQAQDLRQGRQDGLRRFAYRFSRGNYYKRPPSWVLQSKSPCGRAHVIMQNARDTLGTTGDSPRREMSITKNPIKMATLSFVCLSALFLVATLAGGVDNKPRFLPVGILYSLFLTYFATGAILLAKKWQRLLRYALLSLTVVMLVLLIVVYYCAVRADHPFYILDNIGFEYAEILLFYPALAVLIIVPAFGWIGYFRKRRITNASTGNRPSGDPGDA